MVVQGVATIGAERGATDAIWPITEGVAERDGEDEKVEK
jgi:hypothetical protein